MTEIPLREIPLRELTWEELVAVPADRRLLDDLREMLPETTDDSEDPWERAERWHP